jgi:glutathione S-transferase
MSASIVLHQFEISPFCQKVARILRYKGLSFETVDYNGLAATRVGRLSKVGKVPVLDIDGQRLQDSTRIARYLETHYPEPSLFPVDAQQRALVELWEDWADEVLYWFEVYFRVKDPDALQQAVQFACEGRPAMERLPAKLALKTALGLQLYMQGLGRMLAEDVEAELLQHLDRIESVLSASAWLVGNTMTLADIAVGSQLLEIQRTSNKLRPELQSRPHLFAWLCRL